jgi:uncharacterized membrane protein
MDKKILLRIIIALAVIGFFTSVYLAENHFADPGEGSFCDVSDTVSCSLVNSSTFSELFNVPVSIFGAIWFIFLIVIAWKAIKNKQLMPLLLGWNVLGIFSVVYLIIAEIILRALCPLCTIVHVIILLTLIMSLILYKRNKVKIKNPSKILKPWIIAIIIVNIIPLIIFNVPTGEKENYDTLAQCITEKGVNMYGSFRCGVCAKTRAMFGDSFEYINEIECHPQGENPQTELCIEKELEGTPTWILEPNGEELKKYTGFLSIEELKEFSGCN